MARSYTPQDGYAIMTLLARQATGQENISVADTTTFVSAGETVMSTGIENVFNALSIVIGRTMIASRAYKGKLALMNSLNSGAFSARLRKISFYSKDPLPSGYFNTNLYTNLADGFTNGQNPDGGGDPQSTKSQWEQHPAYPMEMNFYSVVPWQHCITMYEDQIKAAFRDPVEFAQFVAGMMTEHENDIEQVREAFNRMALLAKIGQAYLYTEGTKWTTGQSINLTAEFNTEFGTNYTSAQLRSTYLKEFLAFMTVKIKQTLNFMQERTAARHLPMTKNINGVPHSVLRHTPVNNARLYMFRPLIEKAEAYVLPEIFNTEYLKQEQYEPVDYWQANYTDSVRPSVKVRVPYYDKTTGQEAGSGNIELDYVVAFITDVDGLMTDFHLDSARTTPIEARKGYSNTWLSISRGAITDPTENSVLFYMADPVTEEAGE